MKRFVLASLAALWAVFLCQPSYAAVETADLVCETTATTGTGTVNLGGAATGYLGFAAGGISNGATVPYTIQDGASFEAGWGTFTDSSPDTLTRTATNTSDGVGSELNLSGSATVCVGPISSYFRRAYRVAEFFWYTGSTCPAGSLTANGATGLSRTTYADLWSTISGDAITEGSKDAADYGTGDGSTTFSIPDLTTADKFIRAGTYGTAQADGAPDITGNFQALAAINSGNGAFTLQNTNNRAGAGGGSGDDTLNFAASDSNSTYGAASEVRPENVSMTPCIVY